MVGAAPETLLFRTAALIGMNLWNQPIYKRELAIHIRHALCKLISYCQADSGGTSQHCFDPYSLDHFTSSVFQYVVIPPGGPGRYAISESVTFGLAKGAFPWQWFLINCGIHLLWEIGENTPCCIHYFRSSGVDPVYYGDSVVNSLVDIILNACGYVLTWALVEYVGWYMAPILFIIIQLISMKMGAGFFMIMYRQTKHMCGKQKEEEVTGNQGPEPSQPNEAGAEPAVIDQENQRLLII